MRLLWDYVRLHVWLAQYLSRVFDRQPHWCRRNEWIVTRTAPIVDWSDENDETVQRALTLRCGACKAPAGEWCLNTVNGQPLHEIGRWVHHFRLDKAFTDDKEAT